MSYETMEHPRDGAPLVLIPAGPFIMGRRTTDFLAEDHEKPLREVTLSAFWIETYPVTNARFARFLKEGGYERPELWQPAGWRWRVAQKIRQPVTWGEAGWDGPDQPVAGVSWFEADAYARWAGRRLPTDAEWEKAARGTDGRTYPWGEDWPTADRANFDARVGRTTPVGLFPAGISPYGCHDMAGNVNNWTCDWYLEGFGLWCDSTGNLTDPCCDDAWRVRMKRFDLTERIDRGGGFATARACQEVLSCSRKVHWPPETRAPWNGFRTVMPCPVER